jgi:hypothetical protein
LLLRIASVPASHNYVRHLSHPDGFDRVVRLDDPVRRVNPFASACSGVVSGNGHMQHLGVTDSIPAPLAIDARRDPHPG